MAVEFNEDQFNTTPQEPPVQEESGIAGMLQKSGIVKNKRQANYVMIGIVVVLLIVIAFFAF